MNERAIDFHRLIERVLPLGKLPSVDRWRAPRTLRREIASRIEEVAGLALERRAPGVNTVPEQDTPVTGEQLLGGASGTPSPFPPRAREGVFVHSRSHLPAHARARLDRVRRLLRLEDPLLSADPRKADAHRSLSDQLERAGSEMLGSSALRLIAAQAATSDPENEGVRAEALARPDLLFYCPDTALARRFETQASSGVRSLVFAAVPSADGGTFGLLEVTSPLPDAFRPEDLALVGLLSDYCTGVLERAARIEKLVFIDPMTSAYNRSYFELQVEKEMARAEREQSSMALCIADIDDFKFFNSTFGFEAGNRVLVQVAQALKRAVRPFDTVARWGGEEFAVLLTAPVQPQDVITVSERLRVQVERQTVRIEGLDRQSHRVSVSVSIGVALFPDHASSAADLWRMANQALLEAKRPPKNQVVFTRPRDPAS